jgi:hypothetical protein
MGRSARPADYDAVADPYCYPGTAVLRNIPDIRDPAALAEFEAVSTAQRADEPLPEGRLSVRHYRAIHHHLFRDVYAWAGKLRTVRLGKDDSAFCYPENIARARRSGSLPISADNGILGDCRRKLSQMPRRISWRPSMPYIHSARATAALRPASSHSLPIEQAIRSISIGWSRTNF